jgi:tRNA threonylcarbamoyl adenosine modification protein YeaZ
VLVLALDTSTEAITVAVAEADHVRAECLEVAANKHGELLGPMVARVLDDARVRRSDIELVAAGVGPGPFTGLRVGMATAAALSDALAVPLRGVCSLDAIAHAAERPWASGFAVLSDARRRSVYWASYAGDGRDGEPAVDEPAVVAARLPAGGVAVGAGAVRYADQLAPLVVDGAEPYPRASIVARLALDDRWVVPYEPMYLRRPDARPPGPPKQVLPA